MLEGGDMKYMRQLRMGDRVLTIDPDGNPRFDDIFIFGEKDADAVAPYIQLTLRQLETNRQAILTCACAPLAASFGDSYLLQCLHALLAVELVAVRVDICIVCDL